MAIILFNEIREANGDRDQARTRLYERNFQVITDDATNGSAFILDYIYNNSIALGIGIGPIGLIWGAPYQEYNTAGELSYADANSVLVDYKIRQNDRNDLNNWQVTFFYAGKDDPTQEPADLDISDYNWQEAIVNDVTGAAAVNSSGDPLEGGLLADRTRFTLTITKNVLNFDPLLALQYCDPPSLNSGNFLAGTPGAFYTGFPGFPALSCKLKSLGAKRIQRSDQSTFYYQRRAIIDVKLSGWNALVRDAGFRALGSDNKLREIIFDNGTRPSTPVLLDGTGHQLALGGTPVYYPSGGYVLYPSLDWSVLGLDNL